MEGSKSGSLENNQSYSVGFLEGFYRFLSMFPDDILEGVYQGSATVGSGLCAILLLNEDQHCHILHQDLA